MQERLGRGQQQRRLEAVAAAAAGRWQHLQAVRKRGVMCFRHLLSWQTGCLTCFR